MDDSSKKSFTEVFDPLERFFYSGFLQNGTTKNSLKPHSISEVKFAVFQQSKGNEQKFKPERRHEMFN